MSQEWYWQHHDDILGPFTTHELDNLIRQGRIADTDQVRVGENSEWMSGTSVKMMFVNIQPENAKTPAQAASDLLAQARQFPLSDGRPRAVGGSVLASIPDFIANGLSTITDWIIGGLALVFGRIPKSMVRWLAFGLIATIAGSLLLKRVDFDSRDIRRVYAEFNQALQSINATRGANTDNTKWKQLRNTLVPQITTAKVALESSSAKYSYGNFKTFDVEAENEEARAALIQASYDLLAILQGGPDSSTKTFEAAEFKLAKVEQVFNGSFISERRTNRAMRPPVAETTNRAFLNLDAATAGFVIVDTLIVLGAIAFFLRKRLAMT